MNLMDGFKVKLSYELIGFLVAPATDTVFLFRQTHRIYIGPVSTG